MTNAANTHLNERQPPWAVPRTTRWAYIAPALGAFLFVGHAWEDGGLVGAGPYVLALLLSLASLVRPTRIAWVILTLLYSAYVVLIMSVAMQAPFAEWFGFFLVAAVPCAALWWARPRRAGVPS